LLAEFLAMDKYTSELREISLALLTLSERIDRLVGADARELQVPAEIAALVAQTVEKRQCLVCSTIVQPEKKYTRGLCQTDYNLTTSRIRTGRWTEAERLALGKLAPSHLTGKEAAADRFETPKSRLKKSTDEKLIEKAKRKGKKAQ